MKLGGGGGDRHIWAASCPTLNPNCGACPGSVAAVAAVFFAEYIIHLPLFNVLLGFPIQLLGLAMVPVRTRGFRV